MSQVVSLQIDGVKCQSCVQAIRQLLQGQSQIYSFEMDVPSKMATFELEPQAITGLLTCLNEAGFEATQIAAQAHHASPFSEPKSSTSMHYLKQALLNILMFIPILGLNAYIPLPLTPLGQLCGTALGALTLGAMWLSGKDFYANAWQALKHRRTNMNTLIALSTVTAWSYSMLVALTPGLFPILALKYHFLAITMILGIVNFGRALQAKAQELASQEVRKLQDVFLAYQPQFAFKLAPDSDLTQTLSALKSHKIAYQTIEPGDLLLIKAGSRFPVEGHLVSRHATRIDQSNMTGESLPVLKQPQEAIYSGTKNLSQDVVIRATCRGQDNHLHQLLAEVTRAQNAPAQTSSLVDKISSRFIPLVISFAALTALGWYTLGPTPAIAAAITHAMSVLLCACPCALGLATPLSMALSLYRLLPLGILVKKASALEVAPKINKVVFDKTGTLTLPSIVQQSWLSGQDSHDTLQALVSLEFPLAKQHPLAQAIVNAYASTSPLPVTKPAYFDQGLEGTIGQQHWLVGSGLALQQRQIAIPEPLQHSVAAHWAQGMSSVYVVRERQCIGVLGVAQQLHPQAQATVNQLKQAGCTVAILSGDSNAAVTKVGAQLGISEIYAEHSASQKKACIERFKKTHTVAMIGDGLNDLSAAKMSDLSFAVNTWTSAAIEADVCLRGNLADIPHFLQVAKLVQTNIQQNLSWTFFYNSLALIGASGALYPWFGMSLNPILSSAAMMVSSLFVVGNAMRLPGLIERQWVKANSSTPAVPQSKVKVAPEFSNGFTYTPGYQQQATPRRASALPLADELIAAPSSPGL